MFNLPPETPPELPPLLTLDAIDTGLPIVEAKARPDARDLLEKEEIDLESLKLRNKYAKSKIKNIKADRKMRKIYAARILRYLEYYSGGVGVLVVFSGFKVLGFSLEQGVLTTLVGSTAVAAIGLVGFIARGLFRAPPDQ